MDVKRVEPLDARPYWEVTSPKTKTVFVVSKSRDGFALYSIYVSSGKVPEALQGRYSHQDKAIAAIRNYVNNMKETISVRRENVRKRREALNVQTDSKDTVQQGASN